METLFSPKNKNFLSPVGFKFIIGRTPNVDYFCQAASIPEVSIGEERYLHQSKTTRCLAIR